MIAGNWEFTFNITKLAEVERRAGYCVLRSDTLMILERQKNWDAFDILTWNDAY